MTWYVCWDEINCDEETAHGYEADDVEHAATLYADADCDGETDGIYREYNGHPIIVQAPDGSRTRVHVCVEYEPTFYADKTEKLEPNP
jgi:hypothetical protein